MMDRYLTGMKSKVTLNLLLNLFDGNSFIVSVVLKNCNVFILNEDHVEETYFQTKLALVKLMKEGTEFESERDMFNYIFRIITNNYNSCIRSSHLKKNTGELIDVKYANKIPDEDSGYDNYTDILNGVAKAIDSSMYHRTLSGSQVVDIYHKMETVGIKAKDLASEYGVSLNSITSAKKAVIREARQLV